MSYGRAPVPTEATEQTWLFAWARMAEGVHPELALLHHIPNGGSRNKREAVKLKRMGVLAGVADLHLPVSRAGYCGLYIEMKYDDGKLSATQKTFLRLAARFGNYCAVCYSAAEAIEILDAYVQGRTVHENLSILKGGARIGTVK